MNFDNQENADGSSDNSGLTPVMIWGGPEIDLPEPPEDQNGDKSSGLKDRSKNKWKLDFDLREYRQFRLNWDFTFRSLNNTRIFNEKVFGAHYITEGMNKSAGGQVCATLPESGNSGTALTNGSNGGANDQMLDPIQNHLPGYWATGIAYGLLKMLDQASTVAPVPSVLGGMKVVKWANEGEGLFRFVVQKYKISGRELEEFSQAVHEAKRMSGRGGAANLTKQELEQIAKEILGK